MRMSNASVAPPRIAGKHAESDPDDDGEDDGGHADDQADARAEHDAGEHVAALVVRAERKDQPASVPPRKAGGLKLSIRFRLARSNGLCGASQFAKNAPTTKITTIRPR